MNKDGAYRHWVIQYQGIFQAGFMLFYYILDLNLQGYAIIYDYDTYFI